MRPPDARHGLRPEDVRTVILTHLDPDHIGGVAHFPDAEFLIHRREYEFAHSLSGRIQQRPQDWPSTFDPTLYDLEDEPHGPFPRSKRLTGRGDIRAVPLPGHTIGQVGVIAETTGAPLLFVADHILNQKWFIGRESERLTNIGIAAPKQYARTNELVHRFVDETAAILLPAHDAAAPGRLARLER